MKASSGRTMPVAALVSVGYAPSIERCGSHRGTKVRRWVARRDEERPDRSGARTGRTAGSAGHPGASAP